MNTLTEVIIAAVESKFEDLKVIRIKRQERIIASYSESNNKIEPTVDCNGRYHAPIDGYEDIDGRGIYGKGEFLPIPESVFEAMEMEGITCERGKVDYRATARFLVGEAERVDMKALFSESYGMDCSFGKVFEKNGENYCYMYVKGNEAVCNAIQNIVEESKEAERAARKALKGEAPEGRVAMAAKIIYIKVIPPFDSWDKPSYKMMVEFENKSTAYGTLPKSLYEAEVGHEFTLKATFKRADGDNTHSFFSRPIAE